MERSSLDLSRGRLIRRHGSPAFLMGCCSNPSLRYVHENVWSTSGAHQMITMC